jgi:hypothetical protein
MGIVHVFGHLSWVQKLVGPQSVVLIETAKTRLTLTVALESFASYRGRLVDDFHRLVDDFHKLVNDSHKIGSEADYCGMMGGFRSSVSNNV